MNQKHTCPRCNSELKLTTASKLTDSIPYVWKCGCGLYATEKDEDYQKRIFPTMKQIPNIEETNTREVEEMITFVEVDGVGVALFQSDTGLKLTVSGSKEFIKEIPFHQQLQKARQDIYTSLVAAVEGLELKKKVMHDHEYIVDKSPEEIKRDTFTIINSIFKE